MMVRPAGSDGESPAPRQQYRWPWFVLGAVVLAIVLAVIWMSYEIARTKRNRDPNGVPAQSGKP